MLIEVTQKHIDQGQPALPSCCALALAFKDAGLQSVSVGINTVSFQYPAGLNHIVLLPEEAKVVRRRFDTHQPVTPVTFDLEISEPDHENDPQWLEMAVE